MILQIFNAPGLPVLTLHRLFAGPAISPRLFPFVYRHSLWYKSFVEQDLPDARPDARWLFPGTAEKARYPVRAIVASRSSLGGKHFRRGFGERLTLVMSECNGLAWKAVGGADDRQRSLGRMGTAD